MYGLIVGSDGTIAGFGEIEDLDILIRAIEGALPDLKAQARRKFVERAAQMLTKEELEALAGKE